MFEVQIVRASARGGLQALRRCFMMTMSDRNLKISVTSPSPRAAAVLSIAQNRIKSVRVRGRLLRVIVANGDGLTVRLRDQDETLRAAEAMMETWDIDPLVENAEVSAAEKEAEVDCGVEDLVKFYVNDTNFRQLVHKIHDQIDVVLGSEELNFEARV